MREKWKYSPILKAVSVILSILFLWGTGLSMLIVFLNMRLGFAYSEQEFNKYFLTLTEEERMDDLLQYARLFEERNNKGSSAQIDAALLAFQRQFSADQTNFRFTITKKDGSVLVSNGTSGTKNAYNETFVENIQLQSIATQDQSYKVEKHFENLSEFYYAVKNNSIPQYLKNSEDFDIWYFKDTELLSAYREGICVYETEPQTTAFRAFETLESAEKYDYTAEFGSKAVIQISGAEGTPGYNAAVWERLTQEVDEKVLASAKYWALIENTSGDSTMIPMMDYLQRTLDGETLRIADAELAKKMAKGIDIVITGHNVTNMEEVWIKTSLLRDLPIADQIRSNYGVFHLVYQYSEGIVMTMFGFFILTLLSCIAMCSMAGHVSGKEGIEISTVHKLPYEYFWILPPVLIFITMVVLSDITSQVSIPYRIHAIFAAGLILMISASIVMYLYTTAVRFKSETFWQSFGLVRLLNFITRIFKNRTLTCIALILYGIMLIALNMMTVQHGGWLMFVAPALDILSIVGLIYCVYAYFELYRHAKQMESGDFSSVERSLPLAADFNKFDSALSNITNQVEEMVARQTKAEHMRTELITNVSHDLKTPLTSIVNYVDLLSREPMQTEAAADYLDVLKRQAARLKKLTIDLVDASKASTGNLNVELLPMNLQVLIGQIAGEYEEQLAKRELSLVMNVPEEPVSVLADGRQIWRVFDNLLGNACKYAMTGSRVYLDVRAGEANVTITLKNVSAMPLNTSPEELMERFVRGDASRHTEGSGLGLSIARDLAKLQHGTLTLQTDGDLFKAVLVFPIYHPPADNENNETPTEI